MTNQTILLIDGPHAGIKTYPTPLPRALMCMDDDFTYHEYALIPAPTGKRIPRKYRYAGRIGKPHWAQYATPNTQHAEIT